MADNGHLFLRMAGLNPFDGFGAPSLQVAKAFRTGDLGSQGILQPILGRFGVAFLDLSEGEALPGAKVPLAKIRLHSHGQVVVGGDDRGRFLGPLEVTSVNRGDGSVR